MHLLGSLNPSWRKTSTVAALRSREQYHKFEISVESESPESLCACDHVSTLTIVCSELYYGRDFYFDSAKCHDICLRLLVQPS